MRSILVALAAVGAASGCAYFHTVTPWDGKIYAGDSKSMAMLRAQDQGDVVKCSEPRFDDMVCMSKDDFGTFIANYKAYKAQCPAPQAAQ
jgi:hypothetical protein